MSVYRKAVVGYFTHTKALTHDVDRIQDVGRKKLYRLDSAARWRTLKEQTNAHLGERGFASGPSS
jgi:hypothetical protein